MLAGDVVRVDTGPVLPARTDPAADGDAGLVEEGPDGLRVGQPGSLLELGEADMLSALAELLEDGHDVDRLLLVALGLVAVLAASGGPRTGLADRDHSQRPGNRVAQLGNRDDGSPGQAEADDEDAPAGRPGGGLGLLHGRQLVGGHVMIPVSHAPARFTPETRGTAA